MWFNYNHHQTTTMQFDYSIVSGVGCYTSWYPQQRSVSPLHAAPLSTEQGWLCIGFEHNGAYNYKRDYKEWNKWGSTECEKMAAMERFFSHNSAQSEKKGPSDTVTQTLDIRQTKHLMYICLFIWCPARGSVKLWCYLFLSYLKRAKGKNGLHPFLWWTEPPWTN